MDKEGEKMKKLWMYLAFILVITIILPAVLVKTVNFVSREDKFKIGKGKDEKEKKEEFFEFDGYIRVYDCKKQEVVKIELEEYVKGVVAAEMPGEFHTEALKAQAVAGRTYALEKMNRFIDGNPAHPQAPLCTGVHCQAYLDKNELENVHGEGWMKKYWPKIEDAVDSTKGEVLTYEGQFIEPLYHSTSGGMTEDAVDVFATNIPYLKSVTSPYEEGAPKLKNEVELGVDEFVGKIKEKYPGVDLNKDNIPDKIKLVERSNSGRVKKIMIDGQVVAGRDIREMFGLNSTNFKITYNPKKELISIETVGYGHGVGMSQWGANGMAKQNYDYKAILKHYYTDVDIEDLKKVEKRMKKNKK
jgi:stage II sporulation protein D